VCQHAVALRTNVVRDGDYFTHQRYNRSAMLGFNSGQFKRSLEETVAWCATLSLKVQRPGSSAIQHRRALFEQAGQLLQKGNERVNRRWFHRQVSETEEWRQAMTLLQKVRDSLGPLDHQLRSAPLRPAFALDNVDAPWADAVAEVVARRSRLLHGTSSQKSIGDQVGGRLLLYVPTENLACGAAQASSCGFFDVNNVPPWDVWVEFSDQTLVSWVPPVLAEVAQRGIDVNPEGCIRWAD
jgi:hypothetical protein